VIKEAKKSQDLEGDFVNQRFKNTENMILVFVWRPEKQEKT
jgi:hypothetical protein